MATFEEDAVKWERYRSVVNADVLRERSRQGGPIIKGDVITLALRASGVEVDTEGLAWLVHIKSFHFQGVRLDPDGAQTYAGRVVGAPEQLIVVEIPAPITANRLN